MISLYEINGIFNDDKFYFKNKRKIEELPEFNLETQEGISKLEEYINFNNYDLYNKLNIDKTYYMIKENPWKIIGVINLHKGYTFIDVAEHDQRVIIKSAFPQQNCDIINEK